jgi:hypothetical protein
MKRIWRNCGLSIVVFGLFLVFLGAESLAGLKSHYDERTEHGQVPLTYGQFVSSGTFIESTTENWESEFLEMGMYALLTVFLFQKGSAESKKLDQPSPTDRDPRTAPLKPDTPWPVHRGGWVLRIYEHSLSLAFLLLFLSAFFVHAWGGMHAYNEEQLAHGQHTISLGEFMSSADFWFQSFQNWQSEFLGLGSMVVLSIFLRQRGSPESKPVAAPHSETGG